MFNSEFPILSPTVRFAVPQGSTHTLSLSPLLGSCHNFLFWCQEHEAEPWVERLEFSVVPAVELPVEGKGQRGLGCVCATAWQEEAALKWSVQG